MAKINQDCPCKRDCPRHGDCQACQTYHKDGKTTCQRLQGGKAKRSHPIGMDTDNSMEGA